MPAATLSYFIQDVDGKTLAHPQIRVLDNKEAKIHIGDRVPLPSAVIQQTTGQVQTTYNYSDIGVLLDILPIINLDRTVQVKLSLEVSSLGSNLGTSQNPAYEIGTRDADSTMLLHDGETAILGGLIQDNDTKTHNSLPILGDFPLLGDLLAGNVNNSDTRTDILLTITPHIVRDWSFPHKELQEIYSGTENELSSKPQFNFYNQKANGGQAPKIAMGESATDSSQPTPSGTPVLPFQGMAMATPSANGGVMFSFDQPQYEAGLGETVELKLYGERLGKLKTLSTGRGLQWQFFKVCFGGAGVGCG